MQKQIFSKSFHGRTITIEIGEIAKQANGACIVRYEDTVVLTTTTASKKASNLDFFPLMVLYQEKLYSVGKIPGGFIKREGRPSDHSSLMARLIDRPIRPLFKEGFRNEIQVVNTILSVDTDNSPEMMAMLGSSLSLMISDVPFEGPIAGVVVGCVNNDFIINPTPAQLEKSTFELTVAGTYEAINMVEAGAKEVSEDILLEALKYGHEAIKELVTFQKEIISSCEKEKMDIKVFELDLDVYNSVKETTYENLKNAIQIEEKVARSTAIDLCLENLLKQYENAEDEIIKHVKISFDKLEKDEVRRLISVEKIRSDGRKLDEIRPLNSQIDFLPRTHGSGLFTRGQTQALSICTLGAVREHQIIDGLGVEETKRFMLHYNFPAFSVGETGRYGAPGRREIGHGALGERALLQVLPTEEEFPYTIRIVSEILESNGSTSQASICAGTLALMAAGVPIKSPVAGIAMGLITNDEDYSILSDIQGMEDHLGDMDFKVAGTKNGVTALQMDIKIKGLTFDIFKEALEQARVGRLHILENMNACIEKPREELSKYAPKIMMMKIEVAKIKEVIGRGGETITNIIAECGDVKIDIEDDGRVIIYHTDYDMIKKAISIIEEIVKEVKLNEIYVGKVVRVEKFGCFIELWKGTDGMCHISKLAAKRVEKVEDVVIIGDEVKVKVIKIDERGRIDLSIVDALEIVENECETIN